MNRVAGKVAIVTGAAGGLGSAISSLLCQEGAKVTLTDLSDVNGKKVAETLKNGGHEVLFVKHDVTNEGDWKEVIRITLENFHKLDTLVNCAGIFHGKSIEDTTLAEWRRVLAINLDGVFLGTKYALEPMKKNGGGSIINISSAGGIVGTANSAPYNASKGGVRLLTKASAIEFSKAGHNYNIRVNSIHPGVIKTPMTEWIQKDAAGAETIIKEQPIGYLGEPSDIAFGALYLASDESRYLTGSELVIDGGWTAH